MLIAVNGRRARAYIYAHRAQRVKNNFQEKELPHFFDLCSYYWRVVFRKPADINDGLISYVQAIQQPRAVVQCNL